MNHGYAGNKAQVAVRLRRVEGQVRGVARMVENDQYCIDILTQISAARAALDTVALELLRGHARHCLAGDVEGKADELIDAVKRML